MSLVAHLPIIESCPITPEKRELLSLFKDVLKEKPGVKKSSKLGHNTSAFDQDEVKKQIKILECLISVTGTENDKKSKNTWLKERLVYFREHHKSHPQMLPPPVAIDWLWVDTEESNAPEIEVPPYQSFSDGGSLEPVEGN